MSNKLIIIILFFILSGNTNYAQQNECPQFEWVEGIKYHIKGPSGGVKGYSGVINTKYLKDNDGNYILAFLLGANNVDTFTLTIADNVIPVEFPDKTLNSTLFIAKLDKDLKLIWHNSLNLVYTSDTTGYYNGGINLGGLALDTKGNIYISGDATGTHNLYKLQIDNKNFMLSYYSSTIFKDYKDGFLLKLNRTNGNAFWLKRLQGVQPIDLKMTQNDSLYLAFIKNKDTIRFDSQQLYSTQRSGIAKLDALGELKWATWGNVDNFNIIGAYSIGGLPGRMSPFTIDDQENIYVSGLIDSNLLVKISNTGQKIWERECPFRHNYYASVVYNNNYVYMLMYLYRSIDIPNPYDFGNGNIVNIANSGSVFLWQIDANTGQTISAGRMWDNLSDSTTAIIHTLTADQNGYLYIAGYMYGKDSIQLGDSMYYITPTTHLTNSNASYADAFVSKILAPAEGMGNVKFLWTIRSKGAGWENAVAPQTSANGMEHYFYGVLGGGNGAYGKYQFADTFYTQSGLLQNEVSWVFGKINTDCSLSTEEISNPLQSVNIYPNPANSHITINNLPLNSIINITDISGRVLYTQYNKNNNTVQIPVNCSGHLSVGMYFVQIINGANRINKKVVVQQ